MRLFVALPIPNELKKEIKRYQKTIAHLPLRLTPLQNLHVTLVFLGETPESKIPQIERTIQDTIYRSRTSIDSAYFLIPEQFEPGPNPRSPRLVWITLRASQGLLKLQKHLARALERKEKRPFTAHITLARYKGGTELPTGETGKVLPSIGSSVPPQQIFTVIGLHLMESKLERSGAKYRIVKTFPID